MAVLFQSDWVKGIKPVATPYYANQMAFLRFEFSFSTAFDASEDKLELGVLPAHCLVADYWLQPVGLTASNTVDIGLMSGAVGVNDVARTVGDQFYDAAAAVATYIRGSDDAFTLLTPAAVDRSIGVIMTQDIAADAAKKLIMGLAVYAPNIH